MKNNSEVLKADVKQFVVIVFDHEQYGINITYVHNIVRMQKITRVPKAPHYFKGVINLRGEIIPVISARIKLGLETDNYSDKTRIIIVKIDGEAIGIIVDEVKEVIEISDNNIQSIVKDTNDEKSNYVSAVGKVEDELVTILNLEGFIIGSN